MKETAVGTLVGADLQFSVLGPVGARSEGAAIELGGPKQRAMLAMLLAHPNRVVEVGKIITSVWGDDAPDTYRRSIHTYVSNLRALLHTEIDRVGDGYRLKARPDQIDAIVFDQTLEDAQNLIATEPLVAAERLREALALWHGRPYADVSDVEGLQPEIRRLEELRLTAVELRIDAELASGRHQHVLAEVGALAEEHPLRERFRAQHMIALYRTGRQADALRAFERTREYLTGELGLEPSQELQDLELSILRHDDELRRGTGWGTTQRFAFLATGIEDLAGAWDRNPQAMAESLAIHDRIVTEAIEAEGGRVFRQSGEGMVAVFTDVGSAVAAAERTQRHLVAEDWGGWAELRVGMAIDLGEAESRGGDFLGPPVTRASRLASAAHGGQVLISSTAHGEFAASPLVGLQVRHLGEHELAGFTSPERVGQLVFDGLPSAFPALRVADTRPFGDAVPFSLPGYEIRGKIGEGALGVVYRAYQPTVGREVAIKVIRPGLANHPRFIHRFEAEARTIARLAHPRIVPLIDFWRDPDGAYLVLQLLSGGTLREVITKETLDAVDARRIIRHVAEALDHAHSQGVAHGDLRPANVLLDGAGNAYLADFDITARLLDPEIVGGLTTGSDYRAPEMTATGPSAAGDIYALGKMAYRLLGDAVSSDVLSRAIAVDPSARHAGAGEFLTALEEELGSEYPGGYGWGDVSRNPYKGLGPFEESDADDFRGRDELVEKLVGTVATRRFVAVVGPSGSGKSSLVRAGLLPALRSGAAEGSHHWLPVVVTPGTRPVEALAAALQTVAPQPMRPATSLTQEGLAATAERLLEDTDGELLVVIDQFEEVFTLVREPAERRVFLDLLVDAVEADATPVRVVTTLRADLYDWPLSDERLGRHLRDGQVTVLPPTRPELVEMIVSPAHAAGLRWEPGLPERIVQDVVDQPGGLPLLQYALTELVENRSTGLLDTDDYERIGGVAGALVGRAETVYARLPPRLRASTRDVLLRLVTVDENTRDTCRRVRSSELESLGVTGDDLDRILTPFVTERLLLADRDPTTRGPTVEVAHEALLREWPRLRDWIEEERESLIVTRKLRTAMQEWENADRHPDYLPTGSRLLSFRSLLESTSLAGDERSFLETALKRDLTARAARQRRRRVLTGVLAGATAVAVVLAAVAFNQSRKAAVEAERATSNAELATARELASSAISVLDHDPELSVLLAAEATALAEPSFETISALHEALYHHRLLWTVHWSGDPSFFTGALSPDGTRLALAGIDRIEVWNVDDRNLIWEMDLTPQAGLGITPFFSRDGTQVVGLVAWPRQSPQWDDPPDGAVPGVYTWDAATGEKLGYTAGGQCPIWDIGQFGPTIDPSVPVLVAGFAPRESGVTQVCDPQRGTVSLLDLSAGTSTPVTEIPLANYRSGLSTSADAGFVAFTESDVTRVIDSATGNEVARPPMRVSSATLGPDGSFVILREADSTLSLWDVDSNSLTRQFGTTSAHRVQIGSGGSRFVHHELSGDIVIGDAASGKQEVGRLLGSPAPPARPKTGEMSTSLSGDGSRIASFAGNGSARVWSAAPLGEVGSFPVGSGSITASSLTVQGGRGALLLYSNGPKVGTGVVFDASTGETLAEIPNVTAQTVRLSPDGSRLAAQLISGGDTFGPVQIHDLESGTVTEMEGLCRWPVDTEGDPEPPCVPYPDVPFQEWTREMAFSPDGSLLALGGATTGSVTVWDSTSGEKLFNSGRLMPPTESDPHFDGPTLAFTPTGDELAVAGRDELLVYDTESWEIIERTHLERLTHMTFAPDGKLLVGSTPTPAVVMVDTDTWSVLRTLTGHNGHINDLEVSPDLSVIASADKSGSVRVWDLESGRPFQAMNLGGQSAQNIEFLDSSRLLVTPAGGPNALTLTLDPDELREIADSRVTRDFTTQECQAYLHLDTCPPG